MKHTVYYLTTMSLLTVTVVYGNECPHRCKCDEDIYIIDCSNYIGMTSSLFESVNAVTYTTWFHLNLSHNNITRMSGHDLPSVSERFLRGLDLSFNNLHTFTPGDSALRSTSVVDLSHNNLTEIPAEFLGTMFNLQSLNLSHNTLAALRIVSISQTLKHLDLSHNNLTVLSAETFIGLRKLLSLDVSYNKISVLPAGILDSLIRLVSLNVSYNQIHTIEVTVFTQMLRALYSVDLSHNDILEFEPWPYLPENLVYFNLSYNKITRFNNKLNWEQDLSINVPELSRHHIDLRNNNFTQWIGKDLGRYHKQGIYTVYDFIHYGFDLSQNPWSCDCHFYEFVKEVQESFLGFYIPRMTCESPLQLGGANILTLNPVVFVCTVTERCPQLCKCQLRPSEGITYVKCTDQKLELLPSELPENNISLDFSSNMLTKLDWNIGIQNITFLNLSYNMISKIDSQFFKMTNLISVDLSFNKLDVLPETVQRLTPESVQLTGNLLLCSCDEIWLSDWLRLSNSSGVDDLFCLPSVHIKEGTRVRDVTSSLLQCHRDIAIIISCTLSVLLFISITAIIVMAKFRYELKVFVYKVFKYHPRDIHQSDTDETKLYDVYISCDEEDAETLKLVKETFLPVLEENPPRYDVFVPIRQMALGDSRADAIVEGIASSRRVLAMVTRGYLATGGWCLYEFDQAHKLLVENGSGKCIVVLLEDIEAEDLQEEPLRSYISQKQFLKMSDKMFWAKMKYELPLKS